MFLPNRISSAYMHFNSCQFNKLIILYIIKENVKDYRLIVLYIIKKNVKRLLRTVHMFVFNNTSMYTIRIPTTI